MNEAYIEFSQEKSTIGLIEKHQNLVATRTLSKFFCLAGIRLGFVFTCVKDVILKVKSPYNVNQITCNIAINLFQNITDDIITSKYRQNILARQQAIKWLLKLSEVEKIYSTDANFVFAKLNCNSCCNSQLFDQKILRNYKIKSFSHPFQNFIRLSFW